MENENYVTPTFVEVEISSEQIFAQSLGEAGHPGSVIENGDVMDF